MSPGHDPIQWAPGIGSAAKERDAEGITSLVPLVWGHLRSRDEDETSLGPDDLIGVGSWSSEALGACRGAPRCRKTRGRRL